MVQIFVVVSLFSQSACYAKSYPWSMFLPAIINGGNTTPPPPVIIFERYQVFGPNNEYVKDLVNNLEWQRCSVGQTWNAGTNACDGSLTPFTWIEASQIAVVDEWRVPTVDELRSLVYCSTGIPDYFGMPLEKTTCGGDYTHPVIISEAFPNVPYVGNPINGHFWSSTTSVEDAADAWGVNFNTGSVGAGPKWTPGLSVRLVRTPK